MSTEQRRCIIETPCNDRMHLKSRRTAAKKQHVDIVKKKRLTDKLFFFLKPPGGWWLAGGKWRPNHEPAASAGNSIGHHRRVPQCCLSSCPSCFSPRWRMTAASPWPLPRPPFPPLPPRGALAACGASWYACIHTPTPMPDSSNATKERLTPSLLLPLHYIDHHREAALLLALPPAGCLPGWSPTSPSPSPADKCRRSAPWR